MAEGREGIRIGVIVPSVNVVAEAWYPAVAPAGVIDEIEARTGKPVVASTQAVLWHALRLAGVETKIEGYGRLLRGL